MGNRALLNATRKVLEEQWHEALVYVQSSVFMIHSAIAMLSWSGHFIRWMCNNPNETDHKLHVWSRLKYSCMMKSTTRSSSYASLASPMCLSKNQYTSPNTAVEYYLYVSYTATSSGKVSIGSISHTLHTYYCGCDWWYLLKNNQNK